MTEQQQPAEPKPPRTTEQVLRSERQHCQGLALKICKQLWIKNGYDVTPERVKRASDEIDLKLYPFLSQLAKWVLEVERVESPENPS